MNYMLCRNRVRNFDQWKRVFDSHADAHRAAGLKLVHLWQELDNPRHVFFLFEVEDIARAQAFLENPDAAKSANESGLIEGDFRFFSEGLGYGMPVEVETSASREAAKVPEVAERSASSSVPLESVRSPEFVNTPEPVKSSEPVKVPEPVKSPEPIKSSEPPKDVQSATPAEPVNPSEPVKSSTPPEAMKGPERVKGVPPLEHVDGWEPVENWPPAEAAAETSPQPSHHRGRWVRSKY